MKNGYMEELKKALKKTTLQIEIDEIDPDKNLAEQGVDSFDHLLMLYAIGDYFQVDISSDVDIDELSTLNKIFEIIETKKSI